MDNNFEQQFVQNLEPSAGVHHSKEASRPCLLPIITLSFALLIESVILVIVISNYFAVTNPSDDVLEAFDEADTSDSFYVWDDQGRLAALDIACTSDAGARYVLNKDQQYSEYNDLSVLIDSGTYSIINDNLIALSSDNKNTEKVLFYDGFDLAYNTTVYDCGEGVIGDDSE